MFLDKIKTNKRFLSAITAVIFLSIAFYLVQDDYRYIHKIYNEFEESKKSFKFEDDISESEVLSLVENTNKCLVNDFDKNKLCLEIVFKKYSSINTLSKTLDMYIKAEEKESKLTPYCHFIAHGIGAGYVLNNKNISIPEVLNIYADKNIKSVCRSGILHGAFIQISKNSSSLDDFYKKIKDECSVVEKEKDVNCFHGLGHVISYDLIEKNIKKYDQDKIRDEGFAECEKHTENLNQRQRCNTGVIMQIGMNGSRDDFIEVKNGIANFKFCSGIGNDFNRKACFLEQSGWLNDFSKKPRDFKNNIKFCDQLRDEINRKACIHAFVAIAIRYDVDGVSLMCNENVSIPYEKVLCARFFAEHTRLKIKDYRNVSDNENAKIIRSACLNIDKKLFFKCININLENEW